MPKKKKRNKIHQMVALLKSDPFTTDELIERTGLSKGTVDLFVNYELKRMGYNIEKMNKLGRLAYRIIGEENA